MLRLLSLFNPTGPLENTFFVIGGLGIFLIGINMMGDSLKRLAGNKLKLLIQKTTSTPLKGIFTGALITILIQSSSATTVIIVSLVAAGLMTLRQSIGVIMGANIGTTITAFLIGLKVENYSLLFVGIGAALLLFFNRQNLKNVGGVITGFGFLFLGLQLMSSALLQITTQDFFKNMMISLSNNWFLSVVTGTALTALVQSSSATIGVLQQLYDLNAIELYGALGILLGANIGTTITVLLASIGGSSESKQASAAHIIFNIFGAFLFILILRPYTNLFLIIQKRFLPTNPKLTIAFAHMFFNLVTTFVLYFFINTLVKIVQKIIPSKGDLSKIIADKLNDELLTKSPILALEAAKHVIVEMGQVSLEMFKTTKLFFNHVDPKHIEEITRLERNIDFYDKVVHDYLIRLSTEQLKPSNRLYQAIYLDTIRDFERIGDHCVNLIEFMQDRNEHGVLITTQLQEEFNSFFDQVILQITNTIECFKLKSVTKAYEIIALEAEIDTLERKFRKAQFNLISEGLLSQDDIHFVDILSNLERISDHCFNIAQNIIDPFYMQRPEKK